MSIDKSAEELSAAMRESLTGAGLTPDEASAMVATWNRHWFREPGTRVLAILPREWVDQVLPLTTTPSPTKLTRVFVARFEILTPQRETAVLALLNEDSSAPTQVARLKELDLGRFAEGALARAKILQSERMDKRFQSLQHAVLSAPLNCTTATAAR
jgi:hypothetical protein